MALKKLSRGQWLVVLGIALVVIDQVIKVLIKLNFPLGGQIRIFEWFRLLFVENEGMAFGMKFGGWVGKLLLSLFRIGLSGLLIWWINKLLKKGDTPVGVLIGLTLITAGAIGNLIDCMFYGLIFSESTFASVAHLGDGYAPFLFGKVVDMFYFPLIDTVWPSWVPFFGGRPLRFFEPVFNFADSCVTVGAFYLILFQYRFFSKDDTASASKDGGVASSRDGGVAASKKSARNGK